MTPAPLQSTFNAKQQDALDAAYSAVKAWAYVTVSAGTPTLAASYNITSLTDEGVGILTIVLETDFASANYASLVTVEGAGDWASHVATQAAGSTQIRVLLGGALTDPVAYSFAGLGAQ